MKHYEKALEFFEISLGIAMSKEILGNQMHSIMLHSSICTCLINMGEYDELLIYFNLAKEMLENYKNNERLEEEFRNSRLQTAISFHNVAKCFLRLNRFGEAKPYLDFAVQILQSACDEDNKVLVYLCTISALHMKIFEEYQSLIFDIGFCHMQQNHYKFAHYFFEECLSIHNKLPKVDQAIAVSARVKLLTCYMEMYQRERVEKCLKD